MSGSFWDWLGGGFKQAGGAIGSGFHDLGSGFSQAGQWADKNVWQPTGHAASDAYGAGSDWWDRVFNTPSGHHSTMNGQPTSGTLASTGEDIASAAIKKALGLDSGSGGGAAAGPQAPDFMKLAQQQTAANRPDQTNPFGFSNWSQDDKGHWSQQTGFNPQFSGLFGSLGGQAGSAWKSPLDNGAQARQHAEDAIYKRETSRLDPTWNQREEQQRTQLLNQGLDPSSEAYRNSMGELGRQRTDAYQTAMNESIMGGGQEAQRTQMMDLQGRNAPLGALAQMKGLAGQSGIPGAGDYGGAGSAAYQAAINAYNAGQAQQQSGLSGLFGLAGSIPWWTL